MNHYIAASSQDATWARSIAFRYPTRFPWWEKRVGPQYWPKLSRDEFGLARGLGTPCLIVAKWKPDVLPSWMFFLADPFWSLRTCAAVRTGLFSDGETNWHSYTLRHQRALIFDAIERNWDTFLPARNRARYVHQVEADRLEGTHEPAY